MSNVCISNYVEYLGTNFVGWQIQKNGLSVQEVLEKTLSKFFNSKIVITGSGRTDAGVHANEQSAHFKTKRLISNKNSVINSLNFFLKTSYIHFRLKEEKSLFMQDTAKERTYKYFIINRPGKLVIEKNKAWHIKKKINIKLMKKGANILKGTHDFSAFRASSCTAKSPIRTIKDINIRKSKNKIILTFVSRSFLQQQVRSMVGALKYLGEGRWSLDCFKKLFYQKKDQCALHLQARSWFISKQSNLLKNDNKIFLQN